jgi:hypothetical protein
MTKGYKEWSEGYIPPESLVGELFFHHSVSSNATRLADDLHRGIPLFALPGRATLHRGSILIRDTGIFVFQIPKRLQATHLGLPGESDTRFEEWTGYKLFASLEHPVPAQFKQHAEKWLQRQLQLSPHYRRMPEISLSDVRCLPADFLIARIDLHERAKIGVGDLTISRPLDADPQGETYVPGITPRIIFNAMNFFVDRVIKTGNVD